jgi:hypothetical protein
MNYRKKRIMKAALSKKVKEKLKQMNTRVKTKPGV